MKRRSATRFLLVFLVLSLCFLCTACGGKAEEELDPNEGLGGDPTINSGRVENEFRMYEGLWEGDTENLYENIFIEFDTEGNWTLYCNDLTDEGYLLYDEDDDATYIYSYMAGAIDGGRVELYDGTLYITTVGYFTHCASEDDPWDYDEVYHRDISDFEGIWYYDNDPSAMAYIVIDGYGNWSYYERAYESAEGAEMDWGTFSCSADESDVYYADSALYEGLQFRMYDLNEGVILWNDSIFYRGEDGGYGDYGTDSYYSWNAELYQRNVSELEGVWYYDEDYSAMAYIVIDGYGNWSYYERAYGEAEGTEMDWGTFSYSTYEASTYYADSAVYDDLSYRVLDFDNDILIWDDSAFYRMW